MSSLPDTYFPLTPIIIIMIVNVITIVIWITTIIISSLSCIIL